MTADLRREVHSLSRADRERARNRLAVLIARQSELLHVDPPRDVLRVLRTLDAARAGGAHAGS